MQVLIEPLSNNSVHIWKIDLNKITYLDKYINALSTDEFKHAQKYRISKKRKSYILTRAIFKTLLSNYLDNSPYTMYKNYYGKSYVNDNPIYFNISHLDDMSIKY